ncbi:MAG TPA: HAMP domain-containing sensor histidine kinase [Nitrososphaeraceae archaeon]
MDNGLNLSHKLTLIVVIPVVVFSVSFEIAFYSITRDKMLEAYKNEAVSLVSLASSELRNPLYFLDLDGLEHAVQNIKQNPSIRSVYVMFPDGRIITDGTPENKNYNKTLNDCLNVQASRPPDEPLVGIENDVLHVCAPVVITEKIGMVRADFSLTRLNDILNNLIITLIMIGGIISIIVIVAGLFISSSISKPVIRLKDAATEISKGNFDVDIKEISARNNEIAELSSQFNVMKQSIVSANKNLNRLVKERTRELEIANEQLIMQGKLQKEFINVAAHELRTPIQPILGLSELLQSKEEDEEKRSLIDIILRNAKRLHRLTENILDTSKIESQSLKLNKEQFNINDLISNVVQDYRNQIGKDDNIILLYKSKKDINFFLVEADWYRITQVISNLLNNAIKFTKEGTISVTLEKKKEDNRQEVLVSVKDSGTGIHSDILPRLFSKFATKAEKEGTGLGLFISRGIVEGHGGRIWGENNTDGKGATFSFSLPLLNQSKQNELETTYSK